MSSKRITALILVIVTALGVFLLYEGTIIKRITVVADSRYEPTIQGEIEICVSSLYHKSFLALSDKAVHGLVEECGSMVHDSKYSAKFPNTLEITADIVNPIVRVNKTDGDGGCTLFQSSERRVERDAIGCIIYSIPEIKGPNIPNDAFRVDYAIFIVNKAEEFNIRITSIEEQGDTLVTWYKVMLSSGVEVYIPQGDEGAKKIASLAAALSGLEKTGEKYRFIDLRFDRVVYR